MRTGNVGDVDVIVVGGGVGGLSSALGLARQGLAVRVLEQAEEFGEVGAGLQIAPNCTRILDRWGLLDEVLALGVAPRNLVMRDAIDGSELTRLDLDDAKARYGSPYVVIHRSDLHSTLLRACERSGVELVTSAEVIGYDTGTDAGTVTLRSGDRSTASAVVAADGLHSVARRRISDDQPVNSAYVAYRGAVPMDSVSVLDVSLDDVVVYVGPYCHFVQYPLRGGEMFNQVAVFRSPKAMAGQEDWGTPDELDEAFSQTCEMVREGTSYLWRDRWWRMFDREPITNWVDGRVVLLGDAAHPPLQYLAQGAVMAIEDAWVLSEHVARRSDAGAAAPDWTSILADYNVVRAEHCSRVVTTARAWGDLWHHSGQKRQWRNELMRARDVHDYTYVDWLYGPTAVEPGQEPAWYPKV